MRLLAQCFVAASAALQSPGKTPFAVDEQPLLSLKISKFNISFSDMQQSRHIPAPTQLETHALVMFVFLM